MLESQPMLFFATMCANISPGCDLHRALHADHGGAGAALREVWRTLLGNTRLKHMFFVEISGRLTSWRLPELYF